MKVFKVIVLLTISVPVYYLLSRMSGFLSIPLYLLIFGPIIYFLFKSDQQKSEQVLEQQSKVIVLIVTAALLSTSFTFDLLALWWRLINPLTASWTVDTYFLIFAVIFIFLTVLLLTCKNKINSKLSLLLFFTGLIILIGHGVIFLFSVGDFIGAG